MIRKYWYVKTLCLISIIFLTFQKSYSQETIQINLEKAIQNAIKTNINIIHSENTIGIQEFDTKAKYGVLLPNLSFSGGWQRTNTVLSGNALANSIYGGYGGFGAQSQTYNNTTYNYNLSLNSNVTLFNGLSNYEEIELSKKTQVNNYILLEKAKQDIVLQVINDYITVLRNIQLVKIDSSTLEDSRLQLYQIKQFVEVGKKTLADVYNEDALVAQNELALEQAKNNVNKSISDLVFTANLPQQNNYTVTLTDFSSDLSQDYINTYVQQNSNIDVLVNAATKNRNDYKSAQQVVNINKTNVSITGNLDIFPTLTGFSSYTWSGSSPSNLSNSKVFILGLTLSYPIFEGFSIDNQKQIAQINLKESNEDVTQLKKQITNDIQKAVLDLKSLDKQIEITDRTILSAQQNKNLAEESYKVGLQTLLDVQNATITYENALVNKLNLIYGFQFSQKQLEYFQGLLKY